MIKQKIMPYIPTDVEERHPQLVNLIRSCIQLNPKHRPCMPQVFHELKDIEYILKIEDQRAMFERALKQGKPMEASS
jgi:hypothetical protein